MRDTPPAITHLGIAGEKNTPNHNTIPQENRSYCGVCSYGPNPAGASAAEIVGGCDGGAWTLPASKAAISGAIPDGGVVDP
mmetsp:Transcript_20551/g.50288  ORF Transcript_20551/g.50288 Transcript_20551/m.50288 type:complete len:81 (-) Transcript_20551:948-1190(-)